MAHALHAEEMHMRYTNAKNENKMNQEGARHPLKKCASDKITNAKTKNHWTWTTRGTSGRNCQEQLFRENESSLTLEHVWHTRKKCALDMTMQKINNCGIKRARGTRGRNEQEKLSVENESLLAIGEAWHTRKKCTWDIPMQTINNCWTKRAWGTR